MLTKDVLKKIPCPACKRKGLHFANHPHAFGYKDRSRVTCRFCHKTFKVKENSNDRQ